MIIIQQVFNGHNMRGFATINTNNKESFLITYCDWELCMKLGHPVMIKQVYSYNEPCPFHFGAIMETYE